MALLDGTTRKALLAFKDAIIERFDSTNWMELATLTDTYSTVQRHPRLLRSLSFGDPDYGGHVLDILNFMVENDPGNLTIIRDYLDRLDGGGTSLSSASNKGPRFYIQPSVFEIPEGGQDDRLVSVMMPFAAQFTPVYASIKSAASAAGLDCKRADDIWQSSVIIQDVFELLVRSRIVICDFTGRNPNVFYEAGIAHTLGKHVVPISQQISDIPSDLQHHRVLLYLNNTQGMGDLETELAKRLLVLSK